MTKQLFGLSFAFLLLTAVFWVVEFYWPSIPAQRRLRRGFGIDVLYWFFTPLVSKGLSQAAALVVLVPIFFLLGRKLDAAAAHHGYGPILALPTWLQAVIIITLGDFIGYWSHRWFHGRRLWKFHAVHHSSKELDWLSSSRLHPVNARSFLSPSPGSLRPSWRPTFHSSPSIPSCSTPMSHGAWGRSVM